MNRLWTKGISLLAAFLLGVALTGVATGHSGFGELLHSGHNDTMDGTLTAKGFKFKTRETSRLVVPAAAFQEADGTLVHQFSADWRARLSAGGDAAAPVNLPDRAVVTRLTWFHDEDPAPNSYVRLYFSKAAAGLGTQGTAYVGAGEDCPDLPCSTTDDSIQNATVNNRERAYFLAWNAIDEQDTHKVVIVYKVETPGPG
jgi:hypothetical protein